MEISVVKTKLMTNNTSGTNKEIEGNGQRLETVTSFKYLGSVVSDECSEPDILPRIAKTKAALTRLNSVWNDRSISLSSTSHGNEVLPQDTMHLIQRSCYQQGSLCQDPAGKSDHMKTS